jgi:hypothetical protein
MLGHVNDDAARRVLRKLRRAAASRQPHGRIHPPFPDRLLVFLFPVLFTILFVAPCVGHSMRRLLPSL